MKKLIPIVILAVCLAAIGSPAFSEEKKVKAKPWNKFDINLGAFVFDTDSSVRLGAPSAGISIDVEEALDLKTETTVFRLDGTWRFSDNLRHRAELSWFSMNRDGTKTLGQDLTIDGVVYPVGTQVNTDFSLDIYKAIYGYSFFQDDRVDIAGTVGIYVMPVRFNINAAGLLNGNASADFTAPLPVFGFRVAFALTPKWFLKSNLDVFYLEYEKFKGAIYDTSAAIEYRAFKNVGFGIGIENFEVQVEAEGNDYPEVDLVGQIELKYFGALLYAKVFF